MEVFVKLGWHMQYAHFTWSRALDQLTPTHTTKKSFGFCATQRFITVFTKVLILSLDISDENYFFFRGLKSILKIGCGSEART
jgi:hypothetical protein